MTITNHELQVLLQVLDRAPVTLAEQLICKYIIDQLVALVAPPPAAPAAPEAPPDDTV